MKNSKLWLIIAAVVVVIIAVVFFVGKGTKSKALLFKAINPVRGEVKLTVTTTGDVQPQNRLAIMPPVSGRIDKIMVKEGQIVRAGQTLVMMSSSDRAAILDAARAQGDSNMEWNDVYKPIPLIAPISGQVIVSQMQPGQTVGMADAIIVLSDRLIVQAQVDETDIGKIVVGQLADITLDAYPNDTIEAKVDHIYYESKTVNNVTVYEVDILPAKVPEYFRSGMSANVNVIQQDHKDVLTLPLDAVKRVDGKAFVFVQTAGADKKEKREVITGLSDDNKVEITSGLSETDTVMQQTQEYSLQKGAQSVNPFMPQRPKGAGRAH